LSNTNETIKSTTSANAIALFAMERRLLATLSEKMTDLIQSSITASMQRVMSNASPTVVDTESEISAHQPSAN